MEYFIAAMQIITNLLLAFILVGIIKIDIKTDRKKDN